MQDFRIKKWQTIPKFKMNVAKSFIAIWVCKLKSDLFSQVSVRGFYVHVLLPSSPYVYLSGMNRRRSRECVRCVGCTVCLTVYFHIVCIVCFRVDDAKRLCPQRVTTMKTWVRAICRSLQWSTIRRPTVQFTAVRISLVHWFHHHQPLVTVVSSSTLLRFHQ